MRLITHSDKQMPNGTDRQPITAFILVESYFN